jgi:hypothetical protein
LQQLQEETKKSQSLMLASHARYASGSISGNYFVSINPSINCPEQENLTAMTPPRCRVNAGTFLLTANEIVLIRRKCRV